MTAALSPRIERRHGIGPAASRRHLALAPVPHSGPPPVEEVVPHAVPDRHLQVAPRPGPDPMAAVYRRRRLTVLGLLVAAVLVGLLAARVTLDWVQLEPPATVALERSTYVVQPGDTLWGIARQVQPTGDVRPLVDRLSDLNGGVELQPGQLLVLG